MATKCILNKSTLTGIAEAIRAKGGTTETMLPSQMAENIEALPSGLEYKNLWLQHFGTFPSILTINDQITPSIGLRPFYGHTEIVELSMPNLISNAGGLTYFFDGATGIRKLYLDRVTHMGNSSIPSAVASKSPYIYVPSITRFGNSIAAAFGAGSVIDFGMSRTASELLASWFETFGTQTPNVNITFKCSDADVKYIDGAWVAVERS